MEPEAFLELPGVSGERPSAQTHLKKLCTILVRLMGRTTKYGINAALSLRKSILYRSTKNKIAT